MLKAPLLTVKAFKEAVKAAETFPGDPEHPYPTNEDLARVIEFDAVTVLFLTELEGKPYFEGNRRVYILPLKKIAFLHMLRIFNTDPADYIVYAWDKNTQTITLTMDRKS